MRQSTKLIYVTLSIINILQFCDRIHFWKRRSQVFGKSIEITRFSSQIKSFIKLSLLSINFLQSHLDLMTFLLMLVKIVIQPIMSSGPSIPVFFPHSKIIKCLMTRYSILSYYHTRAELSSLNLPLFVKLQFEFILAVSVYQPNQMCGPLLKKSADGD